MGPDPEYDRAAVARELTARSPERVIAALHAVTYGDPDLAYALNSCTEAALSPNAEIRGAALRCVGHLARLHEPFPIEAAVPRIVAALKDPSTAVRADADQALSDLLVFCAGGPYERQSAWEQLNSGYLGAALLALFAIGRRESDAAWAQSVFEAWGRHPEEALRGQAWLGLAAMAWEGRTVEWERVLPPLTAAAEGDGYAARCARTAIESIELLRRGEDEP